MIRVLVAEDSTTTRQLLVAILRGDPEIEVVGEAKNGLDAAEMTGRLRPDIVAMDIDMPEMNGFEATKRIMIENPTPVVIFSSSQNVGEVQTGLQALKVGALTLIKKPCGLGTELTEWEHSQFIAILKSMARVKVVRHWPEQPEVKTPVVSYAGKPIQGIQRGIVAIGASTGGPAALNRLFSELPENFPLPILVVQHMAEGFVTGCATWMSGNSPLHIKVAEEGEKPLAGTVYLAGDGHHLGLSHDFLLHYSKSEPILSTCPSATFLFQSAAKVYGAYTIALVLTGMGSDGAAGLKNIREAGGKIMAQDEESSVVYGMPAEAFKTGFVDWVLPLSGIAAKLTELVYQGAEK
jgi:two-component system, chemotaxis family, protein-glutamate methylesterase/glutaminase